MSYLLNLPYCFLFVPLILSCLNTLQNFKITNLVITITTTFFILFLACYLLPDTLGGHILENSLNNNTLFIAGEYKINTINLIFIIAVFFIKLMSFMFFDENAIKTKKLNLFCAIYLINYFAICGILTSNNIFNIFIYTEIYSFSLYNTLSDYKIKDYNKLALQYYNNAILSSIFFMFFVFIVYFTFGTANMDVIQKSLSIIDNVYLYNLSVVLFLFSILLKFFSFNFYFSNILKAKDISNSMFINVLFCDIVLGIYILWKFLFLLFDTYLIFNVFCIKYLFYAIGSYLIIYNSYIIFKRENLLPIVYSFCLITLGYILILFGLNNNYKITSIILFLINHCLVNFLFYILAIFCLSIFEKSDLGLLYAFYKYRFIIYILLLSKLLFPIGFGFSSYWNFMLSIAQNKEYFLFIPLIVEKAAISILFLKVCFLFAKEHKDDYNYIDLTQNITLKNNYIISMFVLLFFIVLSVFLEGNVVNTISIINNGGLI